DFPRVTRLVTQLRKGFAVERGAIRLLIEDVIVAAHNVYPDIPITGHSGASGNQLADDDVLLETEERIGLPFDRGVGEDARRLLERGSRQEALRLQRRLGDPKQDG